VRENKTLITHGIFLLIFLLLNRPLHSLDYFAQYRHQTGLEIHMGRLRDSVLRPTTMQHHQQTRHPVLLNAIYLWACYVARPGPLSAHEGHFLAQALHALADALRLADRVLDVIQASCLLALYFLSNGRILEGSYHVSSAASLALQCGLHRPRHSSPSSPSVAAMASSPAAALGPPSSAGFEPLEAMRLGPPKDVVEQGERIAVFWHVFNLDRCWSVVLRKPPVIPDGRDALTALKLPWPQSMEEYESVSVLLLCDRMSAQLKGFWQGQLDQSQHYHHNLQAFLEGQSPGVTGGFSIPALRVKASTLFERADRLSTSWDLRKAKIQPSALHLCTSNSVSLF
jgi:hypothetical protein